MNVNMTKGSWVLVLIFLTIAFMASLWMLDISVSAMRVGGKVTNEFWARSPGKAYHLAMWLSILSFFSTAAVAVKVITGGEIDEE